jgi:RNA polymerase primary sigma factor
MNRTIDRCLSRIQRKGHLTREDEIELSRRIAEGSCHAFETLVTSHLPFIVRIACRYRHLGLPLEDLFNEGIIGLMTAAARFDGRKGTRFFSYAAFWIRKAILKAVIEKSTVVRFPDYQRTRMARQREQRTPLVASARRQTDKAPAPALPNLLIVSLDDTTGENGRTLLDTLGNPHADNPEAETLRHERLAMLRHALDGLNSKERIVIVGRFGLAGDPMTLERIAVLLGISRERVRQIERRACLKMRQAILQTSPTGHPGHHGAARQRAV